MRWSHVIHSFQAVHISKAMLDILLLLQFNVLVLELYLK